MHARFLLPLLLWAAACSSSDSKLSSAKQDELKEALAVVKRTPAEMQGPLAAAALAEIEVERLPGSLIKTLESLSQSSPDMRALLFTRGLQDSLDTLQAVCLGEGVKTMKAVAALDSADRLPLIRKGCKTDRFELVTNPGPATDAMQYLLAHLVWSHLQENGGASADEKTLIKYLATAQAPADAF